MSDRKKKFTISEEALARVLNEYLPWALTDRVVDELCAQPRPEKTATPEQIEAARAWARMRAKR